MYDLGMFIRCPSVIGLDSSSGPSKSGIYRSFAQVDQLKFVERRIHLDSVPWDSHSADLALSAWVTFWCFHAHAVPLKYSESCGSALVSFPYMVGSRPFSHYLLVLQDMSASIRGLYRPSVSRLSTRYNHDPHELLCQYSPTQKKQFQRSTRVSMSRRVFLPNISVPSQQLGDSFWLSFPRPGGREQSELRKFAERG